MATPDDDIIDLETYAREGRPVPPHARRFRIRMDRELYVLEVDHKNGAQILALAGKSPKDFLLHQVKKGSMPIKIEPEQEVSFRDPGVERFLTLPRDQTEGLVSPRREFSLPDDDRSFLEGGNPRWEAVLGTTPDGKPVQRVVLHGVEMPAGYNHSLVSMYFKIEGLYPETPIDMAYIYPALARSDGQPINNLSTEEFDGKDWQRWSRHRTNENPWRAGLDNIETHLAFVFTWFQQEFTKR